jgi:hypothetical protein
VVLVGAVLAPAGAARADTGEAAVRRAAAAYADA